MDRDLFIEIILTEGAREIWFDNSDSDEIIKVFHGINGKKVVMNLTEDDISQPVADEYLEQLGLSDLIGLLPF